MKIQVRIITIVFFAFLGCVKEVDTNLLNDMEQKIVVNSLFQPDSLMKVHVSISSAINEELIEVENAELNLFKDNKFFLTLVSEGDGWYNSFHYPEIGVDYSLEVIVEDFEKVEAKSSIPELPEFLESPYCKKIGNSVVDGEAKFVCNTHLDFEEINSVANYYEIFLGDLNFKIHEQTDPCLLMDSDLDIFEHIPSLIFTNTLFQGGQKNLVINGLGSTHVIDDPLIPNLSQFDPFSLRFHSVSEEYYNYRKSSNKHFYLKNSDGHFDDPVTLLFVGNPVEMYSNVSGGYGIFAGYNSKTFQVEYVD